MLEDVGQFYLSVDIVNARNSFDNTRIGSSISYGVAWFERRRPSAQLVVWLNLKRFRLNVSMDRNAIADLMHAESAEPVVTLCESISRSARG